MFEDKTYENLLKAYLSMAPEGVDNSEGSIYYDAGAAKIFLLAETYAELDRIRELCRVETAVGEDLDACGRDHGVERNKAVAMKCRGIFVGAEVPVGHRFFADGVFFVLKDDLDALYPDDEELLSEGALYLEAEESGTVANVIRSGEALVPYTDIEGLESATVGKLIISGSDIEDDESYRTRIKNKISGPAENGNRHHYQAWCESKVGVGRARVFARTKINENTLLYNTPNWISAVLLDPEGLSASDATVELVQDYIDPNMEGLGEGVANAGAHFMAVKAPEAVLDVVVSVELSDDSYTLKDAENDLVKVFKNYLKTLALTPLEFEGVYAKPVTIRIKQMGALIATVDSVNDYSTLEIRINGGKYQSTNIETAPNFVTVLGNVTVKAMEAGG